MTAQTNLNRQHYKYIMDDLSSENLPGIRNFLDPNEKDHFSYLKLHAKNYHWEADDITYNINSLGYRSCEFDKSTPCNIYLGCSHVLGEGLPLEDTFVYLVNKELNDFSLYNLGARGASPEDCFRRMQTFLGLNIQRVIFFVPYTGRRSFFIDKKWCTLSIAKDLPRMKKCKYLFQSLYSEDFENLMYNLTAYATESICRENNIPYYVINQDSLKEDNTVNLIKDARDLSHFGKSTHKEIANKFLDIIK